jgi:hypothetical protein
VLFEYTRVSVIHAPQNEHPPPPLFVVVLAGMGGFNGGHGRQLGGMGVGVWMDGCDWGGGEWGGGVMGGFRSGVRFATTILKPNHKPHAVRTP